MLCGKVNKKLDQATFIFTLTWIVERGPTPDVPDIAEEETDGEEEEGHAGECQDE